jgi:hypothetical protein
MPLTTIQIDKEIREKLKQFGTKDETYNDILKKIIQIAALHYLHEDAKRIINEERFVPLDKN